jgi:sulfur carrier protein ThiS adenylyltransferase
MKKIGIAGVGGIGSNIAMLLTRAGVDNFKIVDFDKIDRSNLNRQFYFRDQIGKTKTKALEKNLKRINKDISIERSNILLNESNIDSIFADCDIIVEGFDKAHDKSMIIDAYSKTGKLIVSACGVAGLDTSNISTKRLQDNVFIVGDFSNDITDKKLFSTKVMIIASKMAEIILKHLNYTDAISLQGD